MAQIHHLAPLALACLLGCGLDESGIVPTEDGGPTFDAPVDTNPVDAPPSVDAPADVPVDVPIDVPADVPADVPPDVTPPVDAGVCDTDANACQPPEVPAGWSPVAYVENPQGSCPTDFGTADDYVTNVTNGNASCSCGCTKTADPSCTTGTTNTKYSQPAGCANAGATLTFTNGACQALNGQLANYFSGTQIGASGGQCSVQATPSGSLQTTPARLCLPSTTCTSAACGGYAPAGYAACIVTNGNQNCPSGSSFSVKHPIAKSAAPSCAPTCGTGCTFQGQCSNPQLHTYSDGTCANEVVALQSDGTCVATNHNNAGVGSVSYSATGSFTGCTATGSSSVQVSLTTQRTVCCRP